MSDIGEIVVSAIFLIDGVNVEQGLARVRGKQNSYRKILDVFRKEGAQKIQDIEECISQGNIQLYTTYVHAIKSTSANIGANEISKASGMLEAAGHSGDWDYIRKNTPEFLKDLGVIIQNIESAMGDTEISAKGSLPVDTKRLATILRELRQALENFDSAGINEGISAIKEFADAPGNLGKHIGNIVMNKRKGEFENALAIIDECLIEIE